MAVLSVEGEIFVKVAQDYLAQINASIARLRDELSQSDSLTATLDNAAKRAEDAAAAAELILEQLRADPSNPLNPITALLNSHLIDFDNPHHTSLTQLGGASKEYIDFADQAIGEAFTSHETNYNNPHQTTAQQLNVYTKHQVDLLIASITGHPVETGSSGVLDMSKKYNTIYLVALGMV